MAHTDWLDSNTAGTACPAPMTRAALLGLRASNALLPECPYVITDHVQNRLVAGTTITMRAVSSNELSEQVEVNTTYDNEAWAGIYDLDRGLVLELQDNRGNVAKGFNGTEVANFDWGNAAYTHVTVEQATLTVTYGAAAAITNVEIKYGANVTLTGFTGTLSHVRIHTVVTVNFTNANGSWRYSEWKNVGTFNATGYTGGGDSYYCEFDTTSVSLVGQTAQANFRTSEFQNCTINVAGAQTVLIQQSQFYSQTINRPAGGGALTITQGSSREGGTLTVSGAGVVSMTGTQNNGAISVTAAGSATISYASLDQSCSISQAGTAALSMTRTTLQGASSNVTVDAGSSTVVTVNDCELRSSGLIRVVGAVGGGALTVTNSRVESNSYIYKRHTGALAIAQSHLQGSSGIDAQSGNRGYALTRCVGFEVARFTLTGSGAVTDTISDIDVRARGQLGISCNGAGNSVLYCDISGLSGAIALTGTTGAQNVNRLKCADGSINFTNCTVNTGAVLCTARDAGVITFNAVVTAKSNQYLEASNQGTILINNSTGGGTNSGIIVSAVGTFLQSGTAGSAQRVDISGGQVSHNGGALTNCFKRLGGTLTTGNFNHNGIAHISNVARTLTVANTSRGDYAGLAPAAYAVGGQLA